MIYNSLPEALQELSDEMRTRSELVHTEKWQSIDISKRPEMATHELRHIFIEVPLKGITRLDPYRVDIRPNLPWTDKHFEERICGVPINPGIEWANWPYAHSADRFRNADGRFNHNYMERYWPKQAGVAPATTAEEYRRIINGETPADFSRSGIYHDFGDLADVVNLLVREPHTRQAILPVWFPEDTGVVHGGRVPCSIYYQFLMRKEAMDVVYTIRSCDFVRHLRDDIYLTIRLLLWVLEQCRKHDTRWDAVIPGNFVMLIGSLHMFRNDFIQLFGRA